MKVLLCEDIKKLGYFGDVVEVANGYARNYLLPQGLGIIPTQGNLKSLADEKSVRAEKRIEERKHMEIAAKKVEGAEVVLAAKANEQGHLFGSISAKDIAHNLREQGFEVADDVVRPAEHIKDVGTHEIMLKFGEDLKANIQLIVVPEGLTIEEFKETQAQKAAEEAAQNPEPVAADEPEEDSEAVEEKPQ